MIAFRRSRFGFFPIFASPSKWEQNYNRYKDHGTNNGSVKLLMNSVLIGCHRPTKDYKWD
jgi:hypothetical protein